ncbi:MAG: hypothetical protein ACOYVF_07550 [Candidatus Zixiibacteriota bacterium]
MEKRLSLNEVERQAYRSTFEDGFYEISFGWIFWLFALLPVFESTGISRFYIYPFVLIAGLIPWLGKRFVTVPRLGAVEFGEKRKAKRRFTVLIGVIAVILMLPLWAMMFAKGFPGGMSWMTVALVAAPVIALGVFLMDYSRMYIYALLFFFSIVASEYLLDYVSFPLGNILAFGLPGAAISCFGLVLLVKFLKEYPRTNEEVSDVC